MSFYQNEHAQIGEQRTPVPLPNRRPLVAITAYDYAFAGAAQEAGVDCILVGDSLANVMLGCKSTREIDIYIMLPFVAAVARGAPHTHLVADMPWGSTTSTDEALNCAKLLMDSGADAVKIEGYHPELFTALQKASVPVMGHLGLLPQTATSFKQVGYDASHESVLIQQAKHMQELGVYAIVLEHLNFEIAHTVTNALLIPTIGIGAGAHTSGQILVLHDVLGLGKNKLPSFAKSFANMRELARNGIANYATEVRNKNFP